MTSFCSCASTNITVCRSQRREISITWRSSLTSILCEFEGLLSESASLHDPHKHALHHFSSSALPTAGLLHPNPSKQHRESLQAGWAAAMLTMLPCCSCFGADQVSSVSWLWVGGDAVPCNSRSWGVSWCSHGWSLVLTFCTGSISGVAHCAVCRLHFQAK